MNNLEHAASLCSAMIERSNRIVLLSGAGMSTSAGLPDFRGPDGIYRRKLGVDPEKIFDIDWFRRDPSFFYRFHREFLGSLEKIEPTFAHRFFASLEKEGKLSGIITQNIDSLHQRAGSSKVLEFHGGVWSSFCTSCGKTWGYRKALRWPSPTMCRGAIQRRRDKTRYRLLRRDGEAPGSRELAREPTCSLSWGHRSTSPRGPSPVCPGKIVVQQGRTPATTSPRDRPPCRGDIDTFSGPSRGQGASLTIGAILPPRPGV